MEVFMKKQVKIVILIILLSIPTSYILGETTIIGAKGYFTVPIPDTPTKDDIDINTGYIFTPGNFYLSLNTSPINNLELYAGKEILTTTSGQEFKGTPFIIGSKYMFYGKSSGFKAALGVHVQFISKDVGLPGTPISIYGLVSDNAGKLGYISTGIGYTLGINAGYDIDFLLALKKAIIGNQLYFIGEFTNFSIREGLGLPWNTNRGIFNAGLLLYLNDFLSFKLAFYDLFDNFLTVGLGGEVKIRAF